MKLILVILFSVKINLLRATGVLDDNAERINLFRRDYAYLKVGNVGAFYKIHGTAPWERANKICEGEGASMFFPENENEATTVLEFWNRTQNFDHFYVGISDLYINGYYKTIDGRPMTDVYWLWGNGEPNNADGYEHCLVMRRDGTFNDDRCDREYPFMCKLADDSNLRLKIGKKFCEQNYKYLESTDAYYKVFLSHQTWVHAKRRCAMDGAFLFYAEDGEEAHAVIEHWNQTTDHDHFFVGISDLLNNGQFVTIDGQQFEDVHNVWGKGEPNNEGGEEHCGVLRRDETLNDDHCGREYPFICKKFRETLDWNCECNIADSEYIYSAELGRCYKFHNDPKNWTEAVASCAAEKSYLAIINNEEEANYLSSLTNKYRNEHVAGLGLTGVVHLGFYEDDNVWRTINGELLRHTGYQVWAKSIPSPKPRRVKEVYGSMLYNGKLSRRSGSENIFYICEHDINSDNGLNDLSTTSEYYEYTGFASSSPVHEHTSPNEHTQSTDYYDYNIFTSSIENVAGNTNTVSTDNYDYTINYTLSNLNAFNTTPTDDSVTMRWPLYKSTQPLEDNTTPSDSSYYYNFTTPSDFQITDSNHNDFNTTPTDDSVTMRWPLYKSTQPLEDNTTPSDSSYYYKFTTPSDFQVTDSQYLPSEDDGCDRCV